MLKSGLKIKKIVLSETSQDKNAIINEAGRRGVPVESMSRRSLDMMVRGNHQGVAASVEPVGPVAFKVFLDGLAMEPGTFVCLLDEVQDPQNLGAIIRNAVCFGCAGVILPKWRSAGLTPAVMKASSGALAHCPVAEISNLGVRRGSRSTAPMRPRVPGLWKAWPSAIPRRWCLGANTTASSPRSKRPATSWFTSRRNPASNP